MSQPPSTDKMNGIQPIITFGAYNYIYTGLFIRAKAALDSTIDAGSGDDVVSICFRQQHLKHAGDTAQAGMEVTAQAMNNQSSWGPVKI